ncbi:MAG: AraC family transcriptional regulator [Microbacteriaceae bacterium]
MLDDDAPLDHPDSHPWRVHVPAATIPERVHDDKHLLLWQARGRSELVVAGEPTHLIAGHALWIPANATHEFTVKENSVLLPLLFSVDQTATTLRKATVIRVDRDLRTLLLAYLQWQISIIRPTDNLGRQILALIEDDPVIVTSLPMPTSEPAATVAETLRFNPGDDRTGEELAASVHASYSTIERAFRKETGITFGQWRIRNRMEAAAMLLQRHSSIPAVANRVGYLNASAFGRVFKGHFGMTPSEYQERYRVEG